MNPFNSSLPMQPQRPISPAPSMPPSQNTSEQPAVQSTPTPTATPQTARSTPQEIKEKHAFELESWFINRARLLNQAQTGPKAQARSKDAAFAEMQGDVKDFHRKDVLQTGMSSLLELNATIETSLDVATGFGAVVHDDAHAGYGYASMVGNEIFAGATVMGAKWRLQTLKAEREGIVQTMNQLPPDHPAKGTLTAQKMQLDAQIAAQDEIMSQSLISFVSTHVENSISSILTCLKLTQEPAAQTAALGGGAALAGLGLLASAYAFGAGIKEHYEVGSKLADIERVSEKHDNPAVSTAIGAVKTAAIDLAAHHQVKEIRLGIFQNAFSFVKSGFAMGISIAAGVGAASVSTAGIALPIISAVGLAISGALGIYKMRHAIGRGFKGILSTKRNPLSLERNLTFRLWRRESELKDTFKNLDRLATVYAKSAAPSDAMEKEIKQLSGRVVELKAEVDTLRYKKAAQSLKDRTGSLKGAQKARQDAVLKALDKNKLEQDKINQTLTELNDSPIETYNKLMDPLIQKAEKKLEQVDAEITRLQTPDDTLKDQIVRFLQKLVGLPGNTLKEQMTRLVERQLSEKTDAFHLASDPDQKQALDEDIIQLQGYLTNIMSRIQVEVDRLSQIKNSIQNNIGNMQTFNPKEVDDFKKSLSDKLIKLKEEEQALIARQGPSSPSPRKATSAGSLTDAMNEMSDETLINEFVPHCKTLFSGLQFEDLDKQVNPRTYIEMEIQKAIAKDSLFST